MMAGDLSTDTLLKELKSSVDLLIRTVQKQSSKHDDSVFLLQSMAGKIDLNGQRLRSVEADVKHVMETLENKSLPVAADEVHCTVTAAALPHQTKLLQTSDSSLTDEIRDVVKQSHCELRTFLTEEISRVKEKSETHSSQVISKLEKVEDLVLKPMFEMALEVKQTVTATESLEIGVRNIENSLNEYAQQIKDLGENMLKKDELKVVSEWLSGVSDQQSELSHLKSVSQSLLGKSDQQLDLMGQLMLKDDLGKRLDILTDLTQNQSTYSMSKEDLTKKFGNLSETILKHFQAKLESEPSSQTASCKSPQQSEHICQLMQKDDITHKLDELQSDLKEIQDRLEPHSGIDKSILRTQYAILDQLISEHQITRGIIGNTRVQRRVYKCDFFVVDFEDFCQQNEREQYSRLWNIHDIDTYLKGYVDLKENGKIQIWILEGRYPKVTGSKPTKAEKSMKVKVVAVKEGKRNWELGETEFRPDEFKISVDCDGWDMSWGSVVAEVECEKFKSQDYIDRNRVVLRYEITVI